MPSGTRADDNLHTNSRACLHKAGKRRTTLECCLVLWGTDPFVRGAMFRNGWKSCLRGGRDAKARGNKEAPRAFVSARAREYRMAILNDQIKQNEMMTQSRGVT